MDKVSGTLRVDAILDDLAGLPVVSLKIVRDEKARAAAGQGCYNLYWPAQGYWRHLGIAYKPITSPLEDLVLEGVSKAQRRGLLPEVATRCTILDVWRKVDYP